VAKYGGAHGELVHVGLAHQDGPGVLQAGHGRGVVNRAEILKNLGAAGGGHPLGGQHVLHHQGHAPQGLCGVRALGVQGFGLGACFLGLHGEQGLHLGLGCGDAGERGLGDFGGADGLVRKGFADLGKGHLRKFGHVVYFRGGIMVSTSALTRCAAR